MEECLTLSELQLILDAEREKQERQQKFAAALKGVDLDEAMKDNGEGDNFDKVKIKAEAQLSGKTEEQVVFDMVGIDIETE